MAFCPETDVSIRDQPLRALLDTGAEANVISYQLAKFLKLPVHYNDKQKFRASSCFGTGSLLTGIVKNVIVDVHSIRVKTHLFIVD